MSRSAPHTYRFGPFRLNEDTRRLLRDDVPVAINPKAFDLLVCLIERAGKVVSREDIMRDVWPDAVVEEANLSQQIFGLRRALGDCSGFVATLPGRGYQFVEPVTVEAAAVAPLSDNPTLPQPVVAQRPRPWLLPTVAASLVLALTTAWLLSRHESRKSHGTGASLLLADFQNRTGNPSLDATLRQALEIQLQQSPYISILGRDEVGEVLTQMGKTLATALTPTVAREVCERTNHQVLVTGDIARVGNQYVLNVEASACSNGRLLAGDSRTAPNEEGLLDAVNDTARKLREQLGESAASLETYAIPIQRATTPSLAALKAYSLAAELEAHGEDPQTMLRMYQQAVTIDPDFALGYSALANIYYANDEPIQAADAAGKAYALAAHVSERERFPIQYHFHADTEADIEAAIATAQAWSATFPRDWQPLILMAGLYNDTGRYPLAITAGRKALALAQNHALVYSVLARSERRSGHYEQTRQLGKEAALHGAMSNGLHATLLQAAYAEHDAPALAAETQWALHHGSWFAVYCVAEIAGLEGRLRDKEKLLRTARESALRSNLAEAVKSLDLDMAITWYNYGKPATARPMLQSIQGLGWEDRTDLVVLQALLSNPVPAREFLSDAADKPRNTVLQYYDVPRARAALALASAKPDEAVRALEPSIPYELADLRAILLRAQSLEAAHRFTDAAAVYQRILDNRGVDPITDSLNIARLGLARTLHKLGRDAESRAQYAALLDLWKSADPDLPVVMAARREAKLLNGSTP